MTGDIFEDSDGILEWKVWTQTHKRPKNASWETNFQNFSGGGPPDPPPQHELRFGIHINNFFLGDVGGYYLIWYMIIRPPP